MGFLVREFCSVLIKYAADMYSVKILKSIVIARFGTVRITTVAYCIVFYITSKFTGCQDRQGEREEGGGGSVSRKDRLYNCSNYKWSYHRTCMALIVIINDV